uniref:Putative sodium-coupled neutral amino acid transporter 11 n=1 Tax=Anopheles melas TaxID=34690 RepID=A0A182TWW4_9DIPT
MLQSASKPASDDSAEVNAFDDINSLVKGKPAETLSSLPQASFNYINSIVGSGVIGIPYALHRAGFGLGLFLLVIVAAITDYSLILMVSILYRVSTSYRIVFSLSRCIINYWTVVAGTLISRQTFASKRYDSALQRTIKACCLPVDDNKCQHNKIHFLLQQTLLDNAVACYLSG